MSLGIALSLMLIALVGGVCITTIGPGGIFVTIALFLMLDLSPSEVAGTASATFIATGLVGSLAYFKSGQLANRQALRAALLIGFSSVIGAFSGAHLNTIIDPETFALLLGGFVLLTGLLIILRSRGHLGGQADVDLDSWPGMAAMFIIGLLVGLPGGLLGVGGPVLAVPLLIILGLPMLLALALAQVQSIFIAAVATLGYAIHGAVDWGLAILLGIPLLLGTILGWVAARRIQPAHLQSALASVLLAMGIYLIAGGGPPT